MKKVIGVLVFLFIGVQSVLAQTHQVTGIVTDSFDNSPLPGVSVFIKGTTKGVSTDLDGRYSIDAGNNAILVFSTIGMETQEIPVGTKAVINVALTANSVGLEEIVVTGYGVQKKGTYTGAASVVGSDKINKKTDANPVKALEGTVAGLQLNVASGQPGAATSIFIRGRNSYNSGTQPLYVIDGVPIESSTMGMRESEGQSLSPLATLNPNDIESMTVLKDATATSIYGARAANGVIVINTKKGRSGGLKVNLSVRAGFETMPSYTSRYKLLDQDKYVGLIVEGILNNGGIFKDKVLVPGTNTPAGAESYLYGLYGLKPGEGPNVNWMDEVTRNGIIQDYNLELVGGGAEPTSAKYYFSFNYYDNEGIVIGKDLQRYSGRFNFEQAPNKIVRYGINSSFSYTNLNMGAGGGYFSDPITLAYSNLNPLIAVYNAQGGYNFENTYYNPVAQRSKDGDKSNSKQYRAIVSPYVTINFTPDLFFTSRGGMDLYVNKEFGFWSFMQPQGNDMRGMGEQGTTMRTLLSITNTLNYVKQFGDHSVNLMLGQEAQHTRDNSSYLAASNYPVEYLNQINLAASPSSASTTLDNLSLASFFFQGQYDYAKKYFLSASVRTDGSSRFGANNRWGVFYSFGGRWKINGENWMNWSKNWLSNFTLRASYGTSGNQEVGGSWYASRSLYGFGYNYNGNPGSARKQAGNPDLKWEQTAKFNVGLDLGFFNNRLNVEVDYYHHMTKDMVFDVPISRVTGLTSIPKNIGKLENKGFEFNVNGDIIQNTNVKWNLGIIGSFNKNEIKQLSTELPIEGSTTIVEPGRDIYTFKMKEWAGVDPETGSPLWWIVNRDDNGNEISRETTTSYNKATKEYVGAASPKFQGGLTSTLNVYNFDLSFQLNYSLGGKIYGNNLRFDEQCGQNLDQITTEYVYDNRWQKPGDITDVPKFVWGNNSSANNASSRFLMKGDYLKIKNIQLGYRLPDSFVKKMRISSIRVYVSADNLYTFTAKDYRGFDPAGIGANGNQWWNYPTPRNVMFGINIGF